MVPRSPNKLIVRKYCFLILGVINESEALSDCQRDITGHLEVLKMRGEDVLSEKELILPRVFSGTAEVDFMVCRKHRDTFGIKWRGRKICQVPEGVASHRSTNHTGDRPISRKLSEEIFNRTASLIPISSGIQLYYFCSLETLH